MVTKRCAACGHYFRPHPQVPKQTYCSAPECQRERRRRAQEKRRKEDPYYREDYTRYNKEWAAKNPEYWKKYRRDHPEYANLNRRKQQNRNKKQRVARIAKEAMSATFQTIKSGRYKLTPATADEIAHETELIVEITVLPGKSEDSKD